MYDVKSMKAEEFISDEEIKDTLAYADANKDNMELVDAIIEKAKERKGLNHREASVLLACENEDRIQEVFELAQQIKKDFYGNRIVLFAPLYLSNYCVNGCVYCPYHMKNKHIARKKLTQAEVAAEVTALQDMGHKRLAIEAGEDPVNNPIEYILECIDTIYSIKHKNGSIRRVNVNIAATTVENYRKLKDAYVIFITETDVLGYDLPIYNIGRTIKENGQDFKDGSHIIYVNGEKRHENTALSILMHDFFCKDAKDIKNAVLANRVRHFKEEESGVEEMCEIMQKLADEAAAKAAEKAAYENSVKIAKGFLKDGIPIDIVAKNTELPREEVEAIAKRLGKLIA